MSAPGAGRSPGGVEESVEESVSPEPMPEPLSDAEIPEWLERHGIPGIVDLHVHFMPERVQQKVWAVFDRSEERGTPPWPIRYRTSEEERVATLRAMGVSAFTSLNYAHRPGMSRWLNDYSADFARAHPDVIHSATFFPEPGVADVVDDALQAGARIFKLHIQVGEFSPLDPALAPVWSRLAETGTPVIIHCGRGPHPGRYTGIEPIRELVAKHPGTVLVIAHMGLPDYREFAQLAAQNPNVYLDTTMIGTDFTQAFSPMPRDFPQILAAMPGTVTLGTDFPTIPYPYAHQLEVLAGWGLGDEWLADVLWHTPRRLVGLDR